MLIVVLFFSLIWIVVCASLYTILRTQRGSLLAATIVMLLPGVLLAASVASIPMLILALGTVPVAIAATAFKLRPRNFVIAEFVLTGLGIWICSFEVQSHLDRVAALQAEFPLEKLSDRLPPPSPFTLTSTPIADTERAPPLDERSKRRMIGLKALHNSQLEHFIDSPGFGMNRMAYLRVFHFSKQPPPDRPVIPIESSPGSYQVFEGLTEARLKEYHNQGVDDFVNPAGYGWIKDQQAVAGFQEHQFSKWPAFTERKSSDAPRDQWNIVQLQLISVLKHDPPLVYESTKLPRMDELKESAVRPLTPFESDGLESLHSGKSSTIFAQRHDKTAKMLGAIRARSDCRDCHHVPEGALLGAFSYELIEIKPAEYVPTDDE